MQEPQYIKHVCKSQKKSVVKAAYIRRRLPQFCPWLTAEARATVQTWVAADLAREPVRWRTRYRHIAGSAVIHTGLASLDVLARDVNTAVVHPFSDPSFLAALAAQPADRRQRSRTDAMEALVADVLPSTLVERSTKASFGEVFWGKQSRAVMAAWNGDGVDPAIVDVERLHAEWSSPTPDPHTVALLQSVWLAQTAGAFAG
jgi:asparagine synthase (glutamine-hydrolysing)